MRPFPRSRRTVRLKEVVYAIVGIVKPELRIDQAVVIFINYFLRFMSHRPQEMRNSVYSYSSDVPPEPSPGIMERMMIEAVLHINDPGSILVYVDAHSRINDCFLIRTFYEGSRDLFPCLPYHPSVTCDDTSGITDDGNNRSEFWFNHSCSTYY